MSTPSEAIKDTNGSERRKPRTLILCFDGTADQFNSENTNVVKFYSLLKKDVDCDHQLCYYQPGVGTYFNPGVVSPIFQWCAKILDEAFAWYLDMHVREGYRFLMQNYNPGDKICLFGFSRGAYTARALAGMLHKIGLLPKDNPQQVPFAYKLYKNTDADSIELAAGFKKTFCRDVQIEFVGVWDTITSVGVLMCRTLPFTGANTTIKTFRHALSLDEHRVRFLPNLYHWSTPSDGSGTTTTAHTDISTSDSSARAKVKPFAADVKRQRSLGSFFRRRPSKQRSAAPSKARQATEVDLEAETTAASDAFQPSDPAMPSGRSDVIIRTDVLEVWFAGCHSDVGGGSVPNSTKLSLSDVTLRWMVREVAQAQTGIEFDQAAMKRANIPESIFMEVKRVEHINLQEQLGPSISDPKLGLEPQAPTGPMEGDGAPLYVDIDALQPIYDELKIDPAWWLLEIVPLTYSVRDANGKTQTKWWVHLGRGRQLSGKPKFHISVKERMEDASLKYTPRAIWTAGTETYVI